jgi:hypothetical protein
MVMEACGQARQGLIDAATQRARLQSRGAHAILLWTAVG